MTLEPGDIITTGTPPGVGMGMKPPRFLKPGDVMRLGIEGLGEQRQRFVAFEGHPVDTSKSWKGHQGPRRHGRPNVGHESRSHSVSSPRRRGSRITTREEKAR